MNKTRHTRHSRHSRYRRYRAPLEGEVTPPTDIKVTGVAFDPKTTVLQVGMTGSGMIMITPEDATNQGVKIVVTDPAIATVTLTEQGEGEGDPGYLPVDIVILAEGTTTVTVTTDDGGHTATMDVEGRTTL